MKKIILVFSIFLLSAWSKANAQNVIGLEDKMLHMSVNLISDESDPKILFERIDRAKAAGANTVLFSDSKLNTYGLNGTFSAKWDERMKILADGIRERGMKLHFITIAMGFASSLIADDVNLTTGYPIVSQKLKATNGRLVPQSTATIVNGGFEDAEGNEVIGWRSQDAIGERTFVDTEIKRSGNSSFRAEAKDGEASRIFTDFEVEPFHQYTLQFSVRTENLTTRNLSALIRDANTIGDPNQEVRTLTNLHISLPREDELGGQTYYNGANDLTTDGWQVVRIAFNSLEATRVDLALAIFGGQEGTIWWDDVEIIDSPFLNWINRDDLPKSVVHSNGQALSFGNDVAIPVDEKLGNSRFPGNFDTQHLPPQVNINNTGSIGEGDIVEISGYHALPTASGQISASWNHPEIFERMRKIHETLYQDFEPDGFLLNYSEIRTGGWEPSDTLIGTSGMALSASIEQAFNDLFEVAPDVDYYFWSDMIDPEHNAKENYYQVNNTLDQSWKSLANNPGKVTLATWWEGQRIVDQGTNSLRFFSDLGFKQIVGAFYDADVNENFNQWQTAAQGTDNVVGSIYATWVTPRNFTQIEAFGELWWQEDGSNQSIVGELWRLENKATNKWIRTRGCASDTNETTPLVVTTTNNTGQCTMFKFLPTDDGYYYLQNVATNGKFRPNACNNTSNDSIEIVQVSSSAFGWCEQWALVAIDDSDYFRIQNRQTNGWIRSKDCSVNTDESVAITQVNQNYKGDCTAWKLVAN